MSQIRLNYVTLISMKPDIMRELNVDDIIKRFAKKKREKTFHLILFMYITASIIFQTLGARGAFLIETRLL